jgi:putative aldouronate transport system substrate-binding protein
MKRLLCAVLAAIMLISLAACGGGGSGAGATTTAAAATTAAPAATTAAETEKADSAGGAPSGDDWRTPYKDTVTIHIVNTENAGVKFEEGMDIYDNVWTRRWKELYNVEIITDWVSSDYEVKLNVSIASKQLPDMFWTNNVQFQQLLQASLLQDITEEYDKWASPSLRNIISRDAEMFETAKKDGRLFGMPRLHYGYECEPTHLWIRRDWMAEAGNPEVKTVDQWESLMRTFKEQHDSPYAMSMDKDLYPFFALAYGWHAYPRQPYNRFWVESDDGGIISGYVMPEMKSALASWSSWYKEGLIRQDFATTDSDMMQQDFVNGNVGMCGGANWYGWTWQDVCKNFGEEAFMDAYPIPSIDGNTVYYPIGFINDGYGVVLKGAKNPEVIVKLINDYAYVLNEAALVGDMTPEETVPYAVEQHHVVGPFKVLLRHYEDVREVHDSIQTGVEKLSTGYALNYYTECMKWVTNKDIAGMGRYAQQGHDGASIYQATYFFDNGQFLFTKAWGPPPPKELDNGKILDDIINEGLTRIIIGEEQVDYWDTVVANWLSAGGEEMTEEINSVYGG